MTDTRRPFSPRTLADRWDCSPQKVRCMIRDGEIAAFSIGKLLRIPAAEVERIECQQMANIESSHTGVPSPSDSMTANEAAFASRLARMTEGSQKLALVRSGSSEQSPHRSA